MTQIYKSNQMPQTPQNAKEEKSILAFFLNALKMFLSYLSAVFCLIAPSYGNDIVILFSMEKTDNSL